MSCAVPPFALDALSKDQQAEFWACLALRHTPKVGSRSQKKLLSYFGSALMAVKHPREWGEAEVASEKASVILADTWREQAKAEWEKARFFQGSILLWTSPDYPPALRELVDAPIVLYLRGQRSLLGAPKLAIVGTRDCSTEGARAAAYFAKALSASGVTVVSGLAAGVDHVAHQSALEHIGSTIAVLGCGADVVYPQTAHDLHAKIGEQGLLISELAPGTPPVASHFPIRNRIISGLSLGTLVIEAAPKSGSLITAQYALEQNRTVYAVAGALGSQRAKGCQQLIRQGARPVFEVSDIMEDLFAALRHTLQTNEVLEVLPGPEPMEEEPASKSIVQNTGSTSKPNSSEAALCAVLAGSAKALNLDELCSLLAEQYPHYALDVSNLGSLLLQMEVAGTIRRLPGMLYSL